MSFAENITKEKRRKMKYRNKPCEVCGEIDSSKRRVCLNCKIKYPRQISAKGGAPFNRKERQARKKNEKS